MIGGLFGNDEEIIIRRFEIVYGERIRHAMGDVQCFFLSYADSGVEYGKGIANSYHVSWICMDDYAMGQIKLGVIIRRVKFIEYSE